MEEALRVKFERDGMFNGRFMPKGDVDYERRRGPQYRFFGQRRELKDILKELRRVLRRDTKRR